MVRERSVVIRGESVVTHDVLFCIGRATQTPGFSLVCRTRLSWTLARDVAMLHTTAMTLPDLGPERPGQASETREMVERRRATETGAEVSNQAFLIALGVIVAGIVLIALLLR
jgi:hypothetical protein